MADLIRLAGTDRRCDRGVDGRDLSPAETGLDQSTESDVSNFGLPPFLAETQSWACSTAVAFDKRVTRRGCLRLPRPTSIKLDRAAASVS